MNEQAIPVLIAFLTVAGIAGWLLRRAFATLERRQIKSETDPAQVPPVGGPDLSGAETRAEP